MPDIAKLSVKVDPQGIKDTSSQLSNLTKEGGKAQGSMTSFAKSVAGYTTLAGVAVDVTKRVLGTIKDLAVESVSMAASFETAQVTWGVLMQDMELGKQVFSDIKQFAAETPLSFQGIEQSAQTLAGFGVEADQLIDTIGRLGDLSRGDNSALGGLSLVFGQVRAQGRAMTQDLYQFINAGVPIFNMLAESMGVSSSQIKTLAAEGKIGFAEIESAIKMATDEGGQFYGMMDKTAQTTEGKWSTALDNFKNMLAEIGEELLPAINKGLDIFNANMEYLSSSWNIWIDQDDLGKAIDDLKREIEETEQWISENPSRARATKGGVIDSAEDRLAAMRTQLNMLIEQEKELERLSRLNTSRTDTGTYIDPNAAAEEEQLRRNQIAIDHMKAVEAAYQKQIQQLEEKAMFEGRSVTDQEKLTALADKYAMLVDPEKYVSVHNSAAVAIQKEADALRDLIKANDPANIMGAAMPIEFGTFWTSTSTITDTLTGMSAPFAAFNESTKTGTEGLTQFGLEAFTASKEVEGLTQAQLEEIAAAKMQADILNELYLQLQDLAASSSIEAFKVMGEYLAAGASGADDFGNSMLKMGIDILNQLPLMMLSAGLQLVAINPALGIALIVGSGLVAVGAGAANYGYSQAQAQANALGGVYDSPSLSKYSGGVYDSPQFFAFAKGAGVFGEAGPEAIMPLTRTSGGELGVKAQPSTIQIIINNNAQGTEVVSEERTGPDGQRQIIMTVKQIVKGMVPNGELDGLLKRGGVRPVGVRA